MVKAGPDNWTSNALNTFRRNHYFTSLFLTFDILKLYVLCLVVNKYIEYILDRQIDNGLKGWIDGETDKKTENTIIIVIIKIINSNNKTEYYTNNNYDIFKNNKDNIENT